MQYYWQYLNTHCEVSATRGLSIRTKQNTIIKCYVRRALQRCFSEWIISGGQSWVQSQTFWRNEHIKICSGTESTSLRTQKRN